MSFYLGHPVLVTPIMSAALAAGKRATTYILYYVVKTYPADGKNVDQKATMYDFTYFGLMAN